MVCKIISIKNKNTKKNEFFILHIRKNTFMKTHERIIAIFVTDIPDKYKVIKFRI